MPVAGSVKDQPSRLLAEILPGRFHDRIGFELEIGLDGRSGTLVNVPPPAADAPDGSQQPDGTRPQGLARLSHQLVRKKLVPPAQPVAIQAHSHWAVEAEQLWSGRLVADATIRAGVERTVELVG